MTNRTKTNRATFTEEYIVTVDYQQPDGYWRMSHRESVYISVRHGHNEKNNHEAAMAQARLRFPGCRIRGAMYC